MKTCYFTNYSSKCHFQKKEFIEESIDGNIVEINIDLKDVRQTLVGFGGAFTESSAIVFNQASKDIQDKIIKMYFDKKDGIGYELGRMAINSCDFSLGNYTYIKDNSFDLNDFDISREKQNIIPLVKKAMSYSKNLKMAIAPWSPPAHLKSNKEMNRGGKLLKCYYDFYAEYIIKYILEMQKEGIKIEYLSLQNEPEANQTWDSCLFEPEEMNELVKVIYPKLIENNLDIKILVLDHNRDILIKWASAVAKDKVAYEMIWGLAIHWYVSEDFKALKEAKSIAPKLNILFTEGCIEGGPRPYAVDTGERYARNIIGDMNNGCVGYIDWNLILNEQGGPNHKQNYCDAPMLLMNNGSLIVNSSYYYIGHFSKFLRAGSKIIGNNISDNRLQVLSGISEKDNKIVIICNPTDDDIFYKINGIDSSISSKIEDHTIQTWVID